MSLRNGKYQSARRLGWAAAAALLSVLAAPAQQTVDTPILMGVGATHLVDMKLNSQVDHRPLALEDRDMRIGQDLRREEAVISVRPPPPPAPGPRVRAQALLLEDRDRVKRAAAIVDASEE
jgi:hypothetical protein